MFALLWAVTMRLMRQKSIFLHTFSSMEKPCVPFRPTWWRLFVAEWWMDSYNEYYGAMKDGLKSIPSEMGFKKCYRSDKIHHSSLTLSFPLQKRLWSPIISYLTFSVRRERESIKRLKCNYGLLIYASVLHVLLIKFHNRFFQRSVSG